MRSGRLRKRGQLQSATETRDEHGQAVKTWTTKATVWMGVEPLRGDERISAMQEGTFNDVDIVIRHRSDITPDWRIYYGSRVLEIRSIVNEFDRDRMLKLRCREVL